MKTLIAMFLVTTFGSVATAQVGTYTWFKRNLVPLYANGANDFNAFYKEGATNKDGFLPGYYVTKDGDKVEGEVQYNFPFIMERLLVFRKDGVTTMFSPKDVKAFFVDGMLFESVTLNASMLGGLTKLETYFMIPEVKGKLTLYYYSGENATDLDSDADIAKWRNYYRAYATYMQKSEADIQKFTPKTRYLKKENEVAVGVESMTFGFANKMSQLVSDCPAVAASVKNKEKGYRMNDVDKIVEMYNACGKQ
jgi:hypothetical protein